MIQIDISDSITPTFKELLRENKRWAGRVGKSLGYFVSTEVKKGAQSGSPGGESFEPRIPYTARRAISNASKSWYGRMRQAIGYTYSNGSVYIGWTSPTSAKYGRMQEYGFERRVTPALRSHWAKAVAKSRGSLHMLSGDTTEIDVPARPLFDPMYKELQPKLAPYVEDKLKSYVADAFHYGSIHTARRTY